MKEQALMIAKQFNNPGEKLNRLREYLQTFILHSFHESEAFANLAFVGGTALRFLFQLPRFSEDLDFSLEAKKDYEPEKWLAKLNRDLSFAGFDAKVRSNTKKTVFVGWVDVSELLHEVGLSGHKQQKLSIKIEIDQNPPKGADFKTTVVNLHFLVAFRHYDLSSLMAGKIHALGCRQYLKGRDWYDFLWYGAKRPPVEPNLGLLQAAVDQTEKIPWKAHNWKNHLLEKMENRPYWQMPK